MLDLNYVRQNQAAVEENVKRRKATADVGRIVELDDQRIRRLTALEIDRAALKAASKSKPDQETITALRSLGEGIRVQEAELRQVENEVLEAAAWLPNRSSSAMPVGFSELDNVEVKVWIAGQGYVAEELLGMNDEIKYRAQLAAQRAGSNVEGQREADTRQLTPESLKHHLDIGEALGIIDMPQAAKVAGTRFAYIVGAGARLENALVQLLSQHLLTKDFMWVDPPLLVQEPVLFGTSHFPEGRDQVYKIASEHIEEGRELFLIGSSEPSLFAFGMDRVFEADQLPLKMFAVTPCFRSEVGSWGKDVRGIKRVHQFTKLEMDVICPPDQSEAIFAELLSYNEWLLQQLGLSYRVINKCSGDCGYLATYYQHDVEVWMSSQQQFMETMTDTNATDFQARRLNIKFKNKDGNRELVHTVNDTGVALSRMVAAILDNYQQADGSVKVPEVLQPWMNAEVIRPNKLVA
jgi:seryl-tRNA synthetase